MLAQRLARRLDIVRQRCWQDVTGNNGSIRQLQITHNPSQNYDICIVGGGIVGLGTARALNIKYPDVKIVVLEKEDELATHQTGHNSGVIHMGIYYTPGSLKARLCGEGARRTYEYCDEKAIPYKRCGKLIVATNEEEVSRLDALYQIGLKNEVPGLALVDRQQILEIEPYCTGGLMAIHSPNTGIVDWKRVACSYGDDFMAGGGTILTGREVDTIKDVGKEIRVNCKDKSRITAKNVITCAGLYSDRVAANAGGKSSPTIVPFRGEYLELRPEKRYLVRGNIYPVPNPKFPFLGVHYTPRMDGSIWLGPNAVLAGSREGYSRSSINKRDIAEMATFSGLWKLAVPNLSYGLNEMAKSAILPLQLADLQKFIPEVKYADLVRGSSGVRAQAMSVDGTLVDDFEFDTSCPGMLHVRNAPSPAATSSLAIADLVVARAVESFKL
ncbi:L-2-hydroxyglutarate dehydrogenase, mitochondrial-like [Bolinopsis microptera]|uniref:L-2-hydroxyglutarate dehydrogenase, mitochondrial-like n=1 Tax=Bolinopsis microptera TaxID=2820187 RepID=UPI00307AFD96